MAEVNNFDVLKRMAAENLDIRLSPSRNFIRATKVKAGSQVTMGVAGDVVTGLATGDLNVCLLLFNLKQFEETKARMEVEQCLTT